MGEIGPAMAPSLDLNRALAGSPLIVFGVDEALRYTWFANLLQPWSESELLGRTDVEALGEEQGRAVMDAKARVLRSGRSETVELDLTRNHQRHWYEIAIRREADSGTALVCTAFDISEKKRREIMLQALLREVSHRSRNLLAMVLSIASQTSRKTFDKHTFLARFTGRMQSIARSQDAVTVSDWRGAALSELIDSQVRSFVPDRPDAVRREGVDLQLTPNAALHLGLAMHELVTNALVHGTLGGDEGTVTIRVSADADPEHHARFEWIEHAAGPERVSDELASEFETITPSADSFGMTTLKRLVPSAVGGEGHVDFTPEGFRYELTLEAAQFDPIERGD